MNFLNPAFLWALPAMAIPVALHLLHKRPPKRVLFSNLTWLKEVHKTTMPKKRLRDILLMMARTLLLFFLILFFSRPVFEKGGFFSHGSQNESMILLMDVSASMGAVDGGRSALDWSKERLQIVLRKIPPSVKCGLVVYSDRIEQELAPTDERSRILSAIQSANVLPRPTDVLPALKLAYAMLLNQPRGRKTIVVASDQAAHGWKNAVNEQGHWENYDADVHVVLWESAGKTPNAGVSGATLQLSEEGFLKGRAALHRSPSSLNPTWSLRLQERVVAQGQAGPTDEIALKAQLPGGGYYAGRFELTPDAAAYDDVYYLAGRVPKGFRLLIVDGESGLAPADSETYYLQSALDSPRDPRLESMHVLRPESLANEPLDKYDVIVLANVGEVAAKESELTAWVEKGGGLFLTAGSKWPKGQMPLHFFRSKARRSGSEKAAPPPANSPLLGISGLESFQWDQVAVTDYIPLEPESSAAPLIALGNGDPLLIRKQIGKGVVLCLTTSVDRAWSNLPAKPIFAPLMREAIAALADPLRDQSTLNGTVGSAFRVRAPAGVKSVSVIAPNGVVSGAAVTKEGLMEFPAPALPGLYQVKTDSKETDFQFAVNIARLDEEGDLVRLAERDARRTFPNAAVDLLVDRHEKLEALSSAIQGRDLTRLLAMCLLFLFAAETLLGWPRKAAALLAVLLVCAPVFAGSGNKFVYAQLKHAGAWDPYPSVHERIFQMVQSMTNIPFVPERKVVTLNDPALMETPFLLIKGNSEFTIAPDEKSKLKTFIDRGGFVFIDDTLGDAHGPFAESIRRLMLELYPDRSFQKLPMDHALFRAFFLLRNVAGRRIAEKYLEGLDVASSFGGEGRTAVIFSANDLLGAWMKDNLGQYTFACEPGGEAQRWEAFKLTINVVYFSLTGTYKKDAIHQPFIEMKLGS